MIVEKLSIDLSANTDKLNKDLNNAEKQISSFVDEENKRLASTDWIKLSFNIADLKIKQKQLRAQLKLAEKEIDYEAQLKITSNLETIREQLTTAQAELKNFAKRGATDVSWLDLQFKKVTDEIKLSRDELIKVGKSTAWLDSLIAKADKLQKEFDDGKIDIKQYTKELWKLQWELWKTWGFDNLIWKFKTLWLAAAWLFAFDKIKDWITWFIELTAQAEQTKVVFENLTWSAKEANDILWLIRDFSKKTPFEFTELADVSKSLMSIAWITKDNLIPTLTVLWDLAASQWKSIKQTVEAYNDAIVWEFERLKEFWIRASVAGDKVSFTFKWQTTEVAKTQEAIDWYIRSIWTLQWVQWSMETQSKTLAWQWSNVKDTLTNLAVQLWTLLLPYLKQLVDWISLVIAKSIEWGDTLKSLWQILLSLVWAYWLLWLANILKSLPAFFWLVTVASWTATTAIWLLTTAVWLLNKIFTKWNLIFLALSTAIYFWIDAYNSFKTKTDEVTGSQKALNDITKEQTKATDDLKTKQDELNKKYNEGKIWNEEYKQSTEDNKKALENLALSQWEVQKWLDIINDKQLNYKQQVEWLNWLKLSTSEYDRLIWVLQQIQAETLKGIQLQAQLLQSKIIGLKKPTTELKKASAELNNSFNKVLTTWEWSLATNTQTKLDAFTKNWKFVLKQTDEQIKAQQEYSKQVKISNEQNSAEVRKYEAELSQLKQQENDLIKVSRDAQDLIKKPVKIAWTSTSTWWKTTWWSGWKSRATKRAEKEALDLKKIEEEKAKIKAEELKKQQEQDLKYQEFLISQEKKKQDKYKETRDILKDTYKETWEVFEEQIDKSKDKIKEFDDKITDLKKSISELNDDLKDLEWERGTTLWQRNIEIDKEVADLRSQEIVDNQKIQKLLEEKRLIESNATKAELDEAKRLNELSPTAKFLEEFALKKIALEEERILKEQQVTDLENQKASETYILETFTAKKEALDTRYEALNKSIEAKITDTLIQETNKRMTALEALRQKALETARAMRATGVNISSWATTPATSTTTTNNTKRTNIWTVQINNTTDFESFKRTLDIKS